jgi:NAD(P)-dependent dehydrogenase (short-subunit alcohol dehydrogenase family)
MRRLVLKLLVLTSLAISSNLLAETDEPTPITTAGDPGKFSSAPTVLITGANRGIGFEFVTQYSQLGWNIIATARKPETAEKLLALAEQYDRLVIERLDVTDFERIDELSEKYKNQPIDILLSNAGITPKYKSAFKNVSGVDWEMSEKSMQVNAIAPLKLSQAFMSQVALSEQSKIVVISSKAGSFELGPKMAMMYSYRASKAALNMYIYTLSFETAKKGVTVTLLSPGEVNTMDEFKRPNAIETDESVSKMLKVIENITPEQNGKFLDYEDGRELPW